MIFSLGNLITLFFVLVILIIYRALDRNNRSLEKVKRFSDKVRDSLAAVVEEKTAEMKNLSIELGVNLKTGKEVLKRVREVEDNLQRKASSVEDIRSRLDGYDKSLGELAEMSARVDENLKRIQSESLFVDKVSKRIADASGRLTRLEQEAEGVHSRLSEQNRKGLESLRGELTAGVAARIGELASSVQEAEKRVKDFGTYIVRLEGRAEQMQQERLAALAKGFEQLEQEARGRQSAQQEQIQTSVQEADKRLKDFEAHIARLEGHAEQMQQERLAALAKGFERLEQEARGRQSAQQQQYQASLDKLAAEAEARGAQFKSALASAAAEAQGRGRELKAELAAAAAEAGQKLAGHKQWVEELERLKADTARKLELAAGEVQAEVLKRVEQSMEDYERQMEYRFQKLEGAGPDIAALEQNLRQAMEASAARVRQETAAHAQKLAEERRQEQERAQGEFAALQAGYQELENGLNELKAKAYENVSAQLQVFEDDFFKDLRQRTVAMEERLASFQTELEGRLAEISEAAGGERAALEKRHSTQLAEELGRLRQSAAAELQRLEARGAELENTVAQRAGTAEKRVTELAESLPAQLKAISQETRELHRRELVAVNEALESELERVRREAEAAMAALRSEFNSQRDELVSATGEERTALKEEFRSITERLGKLESDLAVRSQKALEKFHADWESFQAEFTKRGKEAQEEMESRLREVKLRQAELREKAEGQQAALFSRIEEGHKTLASALGDMEKRVKAFAAQTKLFERADELKVQLESKVEEMKREVDRLSGHRKETEELEGRLAAARRASEELGTKLTRLLSERNRVEGMDSDFRKLLSISKDLDQRLGSVTSSQDSLQEIQAKIRELEVLEKATEGRFERLEKKKAILDNTINGVDKSFQLLAELEKGLDGFRGEAGTLSASLTELRAQAEVLAANKETAEQVVRKVTELDGLLADLESRMEKLEKAREWLAKTETRFEHIGKQAQDQVKLLESILKAEKRQSKEEAGAPPLDKRDTVTKLAHLGWSAQEIARTTRLSRGEVELILELAPKK
jgi:chromosome segregation ATPase